MEKGSEKEMDSFFNDGIGQLARLGNLWVSCAYYRENGDFDKYAFKLDSVELELCNDINNLNLKLASQKIALEIILSKKSGNRALLYHNLKKKEAFLRMVQDKAGKGAKYKDNEDTYL